MCEAFIHHTFSYSCQHVCMWWKNLLLASCLLHSLTEHCVQWQALMQTYCCHGELRKQLEACDFKVHLQLPWACLDLIGAINNDEWGKIKVKSSLYNFFDHAWTHSPPPPLTLSWCSMRISTTMFWNLMSMMAATVSSCGRSRVGPKTTPRLATVIRFCWWWLATLWRKNKGKGEPHLNKCKNITQRLNYLSAVLMPSHCLLNWNLLLLVIFWIPPRNFDK